MNNFFDNLCRMLATPMPRSKAIKVILGGIGGALVAPLAFGQTICPGAPNNRCPGTTPVCCTSGGVGKNARGVCCPSGSTCCGGACCPSGYACKGNKCCKAGPSNTQVCI